MRYRMIAIDVDGTMLDGRGQLSAAVADAIAKAHDAGVLVAPCTGRGWRECRRVLAGLGQLEVGVFVNGAVISRISNGQSLDLAVLEPNLALAAVQLLADLPEAVLVFRDANRVGHDYLVTGQGSLSANTQWWFETTGATVHFQQQVSDNDLHHSLRVGLCATADRTARIAQRVRQELGEQVFILSFQAVQKPDPAQAEHILEIFAAGVDKWRGLQWLAADRGIAPEEIAVIGDEINDLAMIQAAGCSVAMGNAIDAIKTAAHHVTRDNRSDGVAYAIERMLEGAW